jgi:hypothetical protein
VGPGGSSRPHAFTVRDLARQPILELGIRGFHEDALVWKNDHRDAPGATDASGLFGLLRIVLHVDPPVVDAEAFEYSLRPAAVAAPIRAVYHDTVHVRSVPALGD